MPLSPDKIADLRVKHLEIVQNNVSRMAGYNVSLKRYCVTLLTAVVGLAAAIKSPSVLLSGFVPIIMFALLDTQYLRLERQFRSIYDKIRVDPLDSVSDFAINLKNSAKIPFLRVAISWSIAMFYLPLAAVLLVIYALLA